MDLEILALLANGMTHKQIAEHLNVSPSYVSKVKTGKKTNYNIVVDPQLQNVGNDILKEFVTKQIDTLTEQLIIYKNILRRLNNYE